MLHLDVGKIQACSNRVLRESRIMFRAADAFFRHRKNKLAVAHQARRRIMHLRIVNPQCDHAIPESLLYPDSGSLVSPDDQKRMNLFRNRPFWRSATPKKTVNKFNWTINRSGPPAIEHSRIVKNPPPPGLAKALQSCQ